MLDKIRVLIIGYGKMGRIHSKYLKKNKIPFRWIDLNESIDADLEYKIGQSIDDVNFETITHVIVAVNEEYHYSVYNSLRENFHGKILMEKPAVVDIEHIDIIDDPLLSVGMVERFNPAIITLKNAINVDKIINIDFTRCSSAPHVSRANIFEDIGIHDIDLYFYLLGEESINVDDIKYSIQKTSKTYFLDMILDKIYSRFIWSKETFYKERKIIVRQTDCTFVVDLQEQTVLKYSSNDQPGKVSIEILYVEKSSPIENEQFFFFHEDVVISSKKSHIFMLKTMDKLRG